MACYMSTNLAFLSTPPQRLMGIPATSRQSGPSDHVCPNLDTDHVRIHEPTGHQRTSSPIQNNQRHPSYFHTQHHRITGSQTSYPNGERTNSMTRYKLPKSPQAYFRNILTSSNLENIYHRCHQCREGSIGINKSH